MYFAEGQARATVFTGGAAARTFDFSAGDTAVFPDNSGHYVENTSDEEDLVWVEVSSDWLFPGRMCSIVTDSRYRRFPRPIALPTFL